MVLQARKNGASAAPTLEEAGPELPFCAACRSDEYLVFEEYVPTRIVPGDGPTPAETSYSCLMCGQFNAHEGPAGLGTARLVLVRLERNANEGRRMPLS